MYKIQFTIKSATSYHVHEHKFDTSNTSAALWKFKIGNFTSFPNTFIYMTYVFIQTQINTLIQTLVNIFRNVRC